MASAILVAVIYHKDSPHGDRGGGGGGGVILCCFLPLPFFFFVCVL